MRSRIFGLTVVAVYLLAFSVPTVAQEVAPKPGPEHQRLSDWQGNWTCEVPEAGGGSMTCDWSAGGFFMVCPGDWKDPSSPAVENVMVLGYSKRDKAYTLYRYSGNGWSDYAKGWLRDKTWTWVYENERTSGGKLRRKQVTCKRSPDAWTYKWERSVEGEPWRVTSEGKCTKVK